MLLAGILASHTGYAQVDGQRVNFGKLSVNVYIHDTLTNDTLMHDSLMNIYSNEVIATIDRASGRVMIRFNPSTLRTSVDSINEKLQSGEWQDVFFTGYANRQHFNTREETEISFDIEGDLTVNDITRPAKWNGKLDHFEQGGKFDEILYLHYDIPLEEYGLDKLIPGMARFACLEIVQAVLTPQ